MCRTHSTLSKHLASVRRDLNPGEALFGNKVLSQANSRGHWRPSPGPTLYLNKIDLGQMILVGKETTGDHPVGLLLGSEKEQAVGTEEVSLGGPDILLAASAVPFTLLETPSPRGGWAWQRRVKPRPPAPPQREAPGMAACAPPTARPRGPRNAHLCTYNEPDPT